MAKEIYLYSPIYDFVAQEFISAMDEAGNDEDVVCRMSCPGGSVLAGWGMAAKMQERKGKTTIKVDGAAMSMAAILLCFADNVEALDVSTIMLHRADMYCETAEDQAWLDKVNESLRAKMKAKIDDKKLKELKGVNIKNLFEDEKRTDVFLTAKEAKQIGLVDKINTLTIKELKAFNEKMFSVAAKHEPIIKTTISKKNTMAKMNLEAFKAKYPKTYAKAIAAGKAEEKLRVDACMVFLEVDPKGVKDAIESGKDLNQKQMAEFALKQNSPDVLKRLKAEAAKDVTTVVEDGKGAEEVTAAQKDLKDFDASVRKMVGLKPKTV